MRFPLSEGRRSALFTGAAIALLLLASTLDGRVTVALAVALLVAGAIALPGQRRRGILVAVMAVAVAAGTVALRGLMA